MENKYRIDVHYYRTAKDVEDGKPVRVENSGFEGLSLKEAYTCKNKMSPESVNGLIRANVIVEE